MNASVSKKKVSKKKAKRKVVDIAKVAESVQANAGLSAVNKAAVREHAQAAKAAERGAKAVATAEERLAKAQAAVAATKTAKAKEGAKARVADGRAKLADAKAAVRAAGATLKQAEKVLTSLDALQKRSEAAYAKSYDRAATALVKKLSAAPKRRRPARKKAVAKAD